MSLINLINNSRTDKNTTHTYLDIYEKLFESKKNTAKNVLEVGIGPYLHCNGGSIKLWYDYFTNANVYGLDIVDINNVWSDIINVKDDVHEIILHTSTNAYDDNWFNENILNKNLKFDVLIDDGPHTLESMIKFLELYTQVLSDDGVLIIEDVQDPSWIETLREKCPEHLKQYIEIHDIRHIKNRWDDLLFVINLSKKM